MKRFLSLTIVALIVALSFFYYLFYLEKQKINFINNSTLFDNYSEYQIINGQPFDLNRFTDWIEKRDTSLSKIMRLKKFSSVTNKGDIDFIWGEKSNSNNPPLFNYTFFDFLTRKVVMLRPSETITKYEKGYYYERGNDSLKAGKVMNLDYLHNKYKYYLKCENLNYNPLTKKSISLYYDFINGHVRIIYSNFSKESESMIKEMASLHGSEIKSSYFLLFDFYDLEDVKCN